MRNFNSSYFRHGLQQRHSAIGVVNDIGASSIKEYFPPVELDLSNDDALFPVGLSIPIVNKGMDLTKDKIIVRSYCSLQMLRGQNLPYHAGSGTRRLSTFFNSNTPNAIYTLDISESCMIFVGKGLILDSEYKPLVVLYRPVRDIKNIIDGAYLNADGNYSLLITGSDEQSLVTSLHIYVKDGFSTQPINAIPAALKNWINKLILWGKSTEGVSVTMTKEFPAVVNPLSTEELVEAYKQRINDPYGTSLPLYTELTKIVAQKTFDTHVIPSIEQLRGLYASGSLEVHSRASISADNGIETQIFRAFSSARDPLPF